MPPQNKTRESIEQSLVAAVAHGQITSWERMPGYGPHPKWRITLVQGARGPQGFREIEIRTYMEAHLICAVLASAHLGERPTVDAWAALVGEYRAALGIEPGADPTEAGVSGDMEMDAYADSFRGNPRLADVLGSALRKTIDIMEAGHGSADAEHAALYSLCTSIAELLDVTFDSYVSTTDTGEDDD
jgi:hypothetical protein